ncbi:unnamed protein product [Polarella glacialis]|uniref:Uncharacterized protein n=1 Tax=Polarella glacialis TaxID=89957 RepID=A0A813F4Y0_POLGL|nr:unnamed protein product [Polarella glacialis]
MLCRSADSGLVRHRMLWQCGSREAKLRVLGRCRLINRTRFADAAFMALRPEIARPVQCTATARGNFCGMPFSFTAFSSWWVIAPKVLSFDGMVLPEDGSLLAPNFRLEPSEPDEFWADLRRSCAAAAQADDASAEVKPADGARSSMSTAQAISPTPVSRIPRTIPITLQSRV